MLRNLSALSLFMVLSLPYAAMASLEPMCKTILVASVEDKDDPAQRLAQFHQSTDHAYFDLYKRIIAAFNWEVLQGGALPTWHDFDQVQSVLKQTQEHHEALKNSPEEMKALQSILADFRSQILEDPNTLKLLQYLEKGAKTKPSLPTEYDLRRAYFSLWNQVNKYLPAELKIPLAKVPYDSTKKRLIREAEDYIKKSEAEFEVRFLKFTGKTFKEYEKEIRASKDPLVKKALALIDQDQIVPVIRRPETARFWVPKVGLQNQFITGSSKGALDSEARNKAEANLYGNDDVSTYTNYHPEFKPKYGTLLAKSESGITSRLVNSYGYGSDLYILKTSSIENRLTLFPSDSLGWGIFDFYKDSLLKRFFPWRYRLALVPFMLEGLKTKSFDTPRGNHEFFGTLDLGYAMYWESQVLGPLPGLKNVEIFQFTENPPTGEFLDALLANGIKIQKRLSNGQTEDWTPP